MGLTLDLSIARDLGVAALTGLAVGIEREWSGHAAGPSARFAGARTFLLLGLIGGAAGWMVRIGAPLLGAIPLAAAALLVVAAYVVAAARPEGEIGATTEVAGLAVLLLGAIAGWGYPLITSGATSVIVLALVEKGRIQGFIRRIGERELAAALEFSVLALVVLPLLPARAIDPAGALSPRGLWSVVLFLSGVNFLGYVARRALGDANGYGITGMLGGLISSTATTLAFGEESRKHSAMAPALGRGSVASAAITVPRIALITLTLAPAVAREAVGYWAPSLVVGAGVVAWTFVPRTREGTTAAHDPTERNPLRLGSAIRMTLLFSGVLLLLPLVQSLWGAQGVLAGALVLGITDLDALTVAMAGLGGRTGGTALAAEGIALGILASATFKTGVAVVAGSPVFRRWAVPGLLCFVAAAGLGLWLNAP